MTIVYDVFKESKNDSESNRGRNNNPSTVSNTGTFSEKKNSNNDMIIQIHNSSKRYKLMTLEAMRIGIVGELIAVQNDAYVLPLEDNINSFRPKSQELKRMGKAAEKLGVWCSRLSLMEISQILKVRF